MYLNICISERNFLTTRIIQTFARSLAVIQTFDYFLIIQTLHQNSSSRSSWLVTCKISQKNYKMIFLLSPSSPKLLPTWTTSTYYLLQQVNNRYCPTGGILIKSLYYLKLIKSLYYYERTGKSLYYSC